VRLNTASLPRDYSETGYYLHPRRKSGFTYLHFTEPQVTGRAEKKGRLHAPVE